MKKEFVTDEIFRVSKRTNFNSQYTWGEVKIILAEESIELKDDDIFEIYYDPGFDHGDSSLDPSYTISVQRKRLETDEEFEKKSKLWKEKQEKCKKLRYETYIKLKEEFDNSSKSPKSETHWFKNGEPLGQGKEGMINFIKLVKKEEKNISLEAVLEKCPTREKEEFVEVWNTVNV